MPGTVARVTEISARSDTSFEDAVKVGLERANHAAWCRRPGSRSNRSTCRTAPLLPIVNLLVTFVLR